MYKFRDIKEKIIPFFANFHLKSEKLKNYLDFCKIAELMDNKLHLTVEGLKKIQEIKSNMNKFRVIP